MSAEYACQVLDVAELSAEEKLLLLLIADWTDSEGQGNFWPGSLVAISGLPAPAVDRFVKSFAAAGFYIVDEVEPDGLTWVTFDSAVLRRLPKRKRGRRGRRHVGDAAQPELLPEGAS